MSTFHYEDYISRLYTISSNNKNVHNMTETYGEILYPSMSKLLKLLSPTENDIFVDLGSGTGKIVLQVFLETHVKEARGIEIMPDLHQRAIEAKEKLFEEYPHKQQRTINFHQGSFLDIPFSDATVAFICSTCFSQSLLRSLGKTLDKTSSIHTVLTLRPICTLERLAFRKTIRVECSWDSALCYVYSTKCF